MTPHKKKKKAKQNPLQEATNTVFQYILPFRSQLPELQDGLYEYFMSFFLLFIILISFYRERACNPFSIQKSEEPSHIFSVSFPILRDFLKSKIF